MDPLHEMPQINKSKKTKRRSVTGKAQGEKGGPARGYRISVGVVRVTEVTAHL